MEDLQLHIRGAVNYYIIGMGFQEARDLDQWLRRRVRVYYWKQWGRPRTRRRNLLKLGANRNTVHMASRSRKGLWRISQVETVRNAMTNQWLWEQGGGSVEQQWISIRYPNGPAKGKGKLKTYTSLKGES